MSDPDEHTKSQPPETGVLGPTDYASSEPVTGTKPLDADAAKDDGSMSPETVLDGAGKVDGPASPVAEPEHDRAPDPDPDQLEDLIDAQWLETKFAELTAAVANVAKRFDVVATQSKRVHEINGELHAQLLSVRGNAILEMMRPGFGGFVRLIGQLDSDIGRLRNTDDAMANTLLAYRVNLANALQDCGLTEDPPTQLDEPVAFSPGTQEINAVVPTDDPDNNQKIARIALPGFSFGDRRLFRERVDVYRYAASAQEKEQK